MRSPETGKSAREPANLSAAVRRSPCGADLWRYQDLSGTRRAAVVVQPTPRNDQSRRDRDRIVS